MNEASLVVIQYNNIYLKFQNLQIYATSINEWICREQQY